METIKDIANEIRESAKDAGELWRDVEDALVLASRLDEAEKQMREALESALAALRSAEKYVYGDPPNGEALGWDDVWPSEWHNAIDKVTKALSHKTEGGAK